MYIMIDETNQNETIYKIYNEIDCIKVINYNAYYTTTYRVTRLIKEFKSSGKK